MIKYLFIYSKVDPAGRNMAKYLIEKLPFKPNEDIGLLTYNEFALTYTENDIVYTDYIDENINISPDTIIFLSRHSSLKEYPTLSVHVTGNITGEAELGGKPYSLARSNPTLMKKILKYMKILRDERKLDYDVRMEVTHHGPTEIKSKVIFAEVGSTEKQWNDYDAISTVVDAILYALSDNVNNYITAVGFGGPHYAPLFTKLMLEENYAVGHIFSKYVLSKEIIRKEIVSKAFEYSDNAKVAILDWKSIKGSVRRFLYSLLLDLDIDVIKR